MIRYGVNPIGWIDDDDPTLEGSHDRSSKTLCCRPREMIRYGVNPIGGINDGDPTLEDRTTGHRKRSAAGRVK